jgi:Protein of unknown function (DUF2863)
MKRIRPKTAPPEADKPNVSAKTREPRLARDAQQLITLASHCAKAGSRYEDVYWEREILSLAAKLMAAGKDSTIEAALDSTLGTTDDAELDAHETLLSFCEAAAECSRIEVDGTRFDTLLIAMPMVAWSRYAIPSGSLGANNDAASKTAHALMLALHAHALADGVRTCMSPFLYSIDQMPISFSGVHKLAQKLGHAAISDKRPSFDSAKLPTAADLLADVRFLIVGVSVPEGAPLFRWQADMSLTRAACATNWTKHAKPLMASLLPGCEFECLLPDAYFVSCREADRRVRPYAIRAAVSFLENTLKVKPERVHAVVAAIGEKTVTEFRISFITPGQSDVVHGSIWPVFSAEEDETEIIRVLRECKVSNIITPEGMFDPEHCDDCGAPLFANEDSEMVHPAWPDDTEHTAAHYH